MRILVCLFAFLSGVSAASAASSTLVYCAESSPLQLNPILGIDGPSQDLGRQIYDGLVETAADLKNMEPGLAESWDVSKDGRTYTFHLRENVQFQTTENFQPSRAMNADDIVFSLERFTNADHPYHRQGPGFPLFHSINLGKIIKGIRKVDPRTVVIELNTPFSPFLDALAVKGVGAIFSKEYGEKMIAARTPELFDSRPVGTGPFLLKKFERDQKAMLQAHPNYFRGRSALDSLIFSYVRESNLRKQKLLTGECQVSYQPEPHQIPDLKKQSSVQIISAPGMNLGYLAFNVEKKPFSDVRVRQAIAHALKRETYVDALFSGQGELTTGSIAKSSWGYVEAFPASFYDPAKAKSLLKEAGYEKGFESALMVVPVTRIYSPNGKKQGEMIQAHLASVGIPVKIENLDWGAFLAKAKKGDYELIQLGWNPTSADPDFTYFPNLACSSVAAGTNATRWCNEKFDRLLMDARATQDRAARVRLYQEAAKLVAEQVPWIPLATGYVTLAASRQVKGLKARSDGSIYFYGASVER